MLQMFALGENTVLLPLATRGLHILEKILSDVIRHAQCTQRVTNVQAPIFGLV